jgi:hypothetical protein
MLVGQKWKVSRDRVFEAVSKACGVSLQNITESSEIEAAIVVLEELKKNGIPESE